MSTTKKQQDPQTIFRYAEAFADAAKRLTEQAKSIQKPTRIPDAAKFAPMVTLDAFAAELYLKCLHIMDLGKANKGHDLKKLFEALPSATQKAIRVMYNERLGKEPLAAQAAKNHPGIAFGLDSVLEMSRTTFETMRYLFELETLKSRRFYWPMLRLAVRDTILASRPDWVQLVSTTPPGPTMMS